MDLACDSQIVDWPITARTYLILNCADMPYRVSNTSCQTVLTSHIKFPIWHIIEPLPSDINCESKVSTMSAWVTSIQSLSLACLLQSKAAPSKSRYHTGRQPMGKNYLWAHSNCLSLDHMHNGAATHAYRRLRRSNVKIRRGNIIFLQILVEWHRRAS